LAENGEPIIKWEESLRDRKKIARSHQLSVIKRPEDYCYKIDDDKLSQVDLKAKVMGRQKQRLSHHFENFKRKYQFKNKPKVNESGSPPLSDSGAGAPPEGMQSKNLKQDVESMNNFTTAVTR